MRKRLLRPLVVLAALAVLAGSVLARAPKKPDVIGTWTGTAVVDANGALLDIILVIEKAEGGYSGKLSDLSGMVPESPLRQIVFEDGKLSFDFDLAQGMETLLIRIELILEAETLKGAWFDPEGNSGEISLALRK
jgi:hypothetical protein